LKFDIHRDPGMTRIVRSEIYLKSERP
jgi:hypothetical protein